ncbi:MAG: transporter substrate-binding domain-containing protein [Rhizobiales bacterium]|nr:transporter substrate-binding domain-containing protein [Hyphomicrobiales bacterium]
MKFFALALSAMLLAAGGSADSANAGALEDIKAKGTLVVGVKADYAPYGFRDPSGAIVGMEPDMAKDVADRLGVKVQLEPVVASNRMQFLQQGKIDLMIATMSVNEERKKAVGIVEPYYYASGVALLAAKSANIKSGADLKGKPVCAIQGAFYNSEIQSKMTGTDLVAFKGVPENEQALQNGQCVGFAYDDVLLIYKKQSDAEKWKDFEVVQLDIKPLPWGLAVKSEEKDQAWGKFMSETVTDWLKKGTLLELEKKWLGQNTQWLTDASK